MAGEWLGGAAAVAAGGLISILTSTFDGRRASAAERRQAGREDRRREEDRRWMNLDQRREVYRRLLRAVDTYDRTLIWIDDVGLDFGEEELAEHADKTLAPFQEVEALIYDVEVSSYHLEVADLLRGFIQTGTAVRIAIEGQDWAAVLRWVAELRETVPPIRDACRRDLGLDAGRP